MKNLTVIIALLITSSFLHSQEISWQNNKTGSYFLYVKGTRSWNESTRYCKERGLTVFNYHYLSNEDKTAFLSSSIVKSLSWVTKSEGYPGERKEAKIWMSSLLSDSVSTFNLKRYINEKKPVIQSDWENLNRHGYQTVCMYTSRSWFGCSHQFECVKALGSVGSTTSNYLVYEYGESKSKAYARIRDRVDRYKKIGATCELIPDRIKCEQHW